MTTLRDWRGCTDELRRMGVTLPGEASAAARAAGARQPRWVHVGGGNLYRAFHAVVAQDLIDAGLLDRGVGVLELRRPFMCDKVYAPYNQDLLQVVMPAEGGLRERVVSSTALDVFANPANPAGWELARDWFASPDLQLVTVTITEKGYAVADGTGALLPAVAADVEVGPAAPQTAMGILASLLLARFEAGAAPVAMVTTDNFSRNGEHFRDTVLTLVRGWAEHGHVGDDFLSWVADERCVSFPWTMIDRITPAPSPEVAQTLADEGWEDLGLIDAGRGAHAAGFANTEEAHYLVVEDSFPNGRPPLEEAGVIMCDRQTAERADTMKVTACLNPLHTTLAVYGCLLGYTRIWQEMENPDLAALVRRLGYEEDLPVVVDPGVIDPAAFLDELLGRRLPNRALPDAPQRIATDTSQKVPVRFGHTLRAYVETGRSVEGLVCIPLAIAGWLRYLVAVDDAGKAFEPSSDPRLAELQAHLAGVTLGRADATLVHAACQPILADKCLFGVDLYECGLGSKVEAMLLEELAGPGAVAATIARYVRA